MALKPIRFTGLSSGMDTDTVVKQMLAPYKAKVDEQKQKQQLYELKKDVWKEMNTKLYTFYTKQLDGIRLMGNINTTKLTASTAGVIDTEKSSGTTTGTHTIKDVKLAKGVTAHFSVADLEELLTSDITIKDGKGEVTVSCKDKDGNNKKMKDFINELKNLKDTNVTYDAKTKNVFLTSKSTGEDSKIEIGPNTNPITLEGTTVGANATMTYNGVPITSSTNTFEINGMKLVATSEGSLNLTVERDTDAIYNKIKGFASEYNKLLVDIIGKLDADSAKNYKPLTEEQRAAMSDKEIELWEKKIKDGLFVKDSSLITTKDILRSTLGERYGDSKYNSLASIGIVTGNWKEQGALHILGDAEDATVASENDKLKKAIEEDPDAVLKLMADVGQALYEKIGMTIKSTTDKSTNSFFNDKLLDKNISEAKERTILLQEKMDSMETQYYKQFTVMEKMMAKMNSQSSWLSQQTF